jgi:LPS-assembly lipoprotein
MNRRLFLAVIPAALAAGCGFKLRRLEGIPFASLYIDAPPGSAVAQRIREALASNRRTRLAATAGEAEAVLQTGSRRCAANPFSRCPAPAASPNTGSACG